MVAFLIRMPLSNLIRNYQKCSQIHSEDSNLNKSRYSEIEIDSQMKVKIIE
jgi:hypothetical protein